MTAQSSIAILLFFGSLTFGFVGSAAAQELPKPTWKKEFGSVEVESVKPEDLPAPEESKFPTALQSDTVLPKPTNLDTLRATASDLSDRVVEVISVERANPPLRRTPVVVRGHAVWVSAKNGGVEPILITNYHWLRESQAIFVRPAVARERGDLPKAERRSLNGIRADADPKEILRDDTLIPVDLSGGDKHRNLVELKPRDERLTRPARGLEFFPIEGQSPTRAYGFSPQVGSSLVETRFLTTRSKKKELLFYLQTTYPAILGAPIVTDDGRLVGITAMRHPYENERTLVIPPGALRKFVEHQQDIEPDKDE